jgi:hypothetical protein
LTNALLSRNLDWLSNIPLKSLIEMRRKGYLSELRSLISQETNRFTTSRLDNLEKVINQVDYNISTALEKHHDQINKLDSEFRSEMSILGSTFLISIMGIIQPFLMPLSNQWVSTLSSVIGTTSLASIVPATIKYIKGKKTLGKTPIGILWETKMNPSK